MFDFPARNSALIAASICVPRAHTGEIWKIVGHLRAEWLLLLLSHS
jgi:hypothetical protein